MTPPKGAPDFPEAEQGALLTAFCISLICHLLPARHELKGQRRVLPRSSLSLPCLHSRHSINMCLKSLLEKWKLNQTACWKNSSLSQQILWQNITIFSGFAAQHGAFRNHSRNFPFLTSSPVSRLSHFHHLLPGRECLQSLSATFWQHLRTALCRSPRPWEVQVHVPCNPPPPPPEHKCHSLTISGALTESTLITGFCARSCSYSYEKGSVALALKVFRVWFRRREDR